MTWDENGETQQLFSIQQTEDGLPKDDSKRDPTQCKSPVSLKRMPLDFANVFKSFIGSK
jgi:hypothetical protein